jgi:long-chain acyl-CoA synthetase
VLATLLQTNAERFGARTALVHGERRLTHAELAGEVERVAGGLHALGVEPGDNVLLVLPNVPEFVIGFFALARLGAGAVLLDVASKEHELTKAFQDCRPRAVITDRRVAGTCQAVATTLGQTALVVTIDDVPSSAAPFHALGAKAAGELPSLPGPDVPLVFQYSSGSTGRPKRVGRTHEQCLAEARLVPETLDLTEADAVLCTVPLFHAYGLGDCMFTAAGSGAKLVLQPDGQPFVVRRQRTLELVADEEVTLLPVVPFMVDLLASASATGEITRLRYCFSAGNALPPAAADAFLGRFGVPARQLYGCTEVPSICANLDDIPAPESVGRPFRHVEVSIRDDDDDAEVGPDEVGTVAVRSPVASSGYVDDSEVETFRGGWVYPGDAGRLDGDGRLTLVGRTKIFIDVVGHKVDPVEVEDVLLQHPAVREVVVVGARAPRLDTDVVKAAVVQSEPCSERELIHFCATRLASFKVPQVVEFLDAIPRSPLGKVLRKELV